jgi:hypothetical protein
MAVAVYAVNVRCWHLASIWTDASNGRFWTKADIAGFLHELARS